MNSKVNMTDTVWRNLSVTFDRIVLLTMSNRQDRKNATFDQLEHLDTEQINIDNHFSIFTGTPFPHNDIIADAFNKSGRGRFTKPNEYDCSRNHYAIIKQAYDAGVNTLLVLEDDIRFLKDLDAFNEYLNNMPDEWDILQFGGFTTDPRVEKYLKPNTAEFWVTHKDVGLWTTAMYALSRRGMEFYLAFMDRIFWVADGPLYKAPLNDKLIKTYMSTIPLVIQADKDVVSSDIRDEENDTIDYKNDNLFEKFVNKKDYFEYKIKQ